MFNKYSNMYFHQTWQVATKSYIKEQNKNSNNLKKKMR